MKTIVMALIESLGSIFYVAVVVMVFWLMFAILGINLMGGKFFYCTINKYKYTNKEMCHAARGHWEKYDTNFDSVPDAMLTLFIISTLEGWPDIMYQALDANVIDQGPVYNTSWYYSYYFVFFIFLGSFFFLNFFVGVIFLNFEEA